MQDPVSKKQSPKKKLILRAWFWMLVGLVIVGVLLIILLPLGIDYGIERYLKDQGADQVSLEDVDFNLLTGRLMLTNLSVIIDNQTVSKISQATLNIEWRPFISKRFVLKRLSVNDAQIAVQVSEGDRWHIGGIKLPQKNEASGPSTWNFGLERVSVKNSIIKFISPQLSSDLKIQQAKISKLSSWLPERKARLEFDGQLNDGKLQFKVDVAPFGNDVDAAGQIRLTGISLAPFARLLKLQTDALEGRLNADLKIETRQTASAGFSYHQEGRLNLQKISTLIGGAGFSGDGLAWDGTVQIDSPESEKALRIKADGQLTGAKLTSANKDETLRIQQDDLDWKGKIGFSQSAAVAELNLDGTLAARDTNITGPEINLSEEKLNWKGVLNFSNPNANADTHITSEGELKLGPLTLNLLQQKIAFENAGLQWQGTLDFAQNQTNRKMNANGQISLADLKMVSPQINLAEKILRWQGAIEFSSYAGTRGRDLLADGALDSSRLRLNLIDRKIKFEHQGLSWKGRLDSRETKDFSALKAEADVIFNGIQILHSETGRPLFDADRIELQTIRLDGLDKMTAAKVTLNGMALLADPQGSSSTAEPSLLRTQKVLLSDVRLSQQNKLAIDSIQLNALNTYVRRDAEGKWPAIARWNAIKGDVFSADQKQRNPADKNTDKKSEAFNYRIGQIDITGDSGLQFKDESVRPAFDIDLSMLEAHLSNLDNRRPEEPASLKLLVSDTKNARLSLDGTLQPFAGQLNLDWVGKIKALELPQLSPYVIQSTGYRFTSGELEADVPLKIDRNELKGEIDLTLLNPRIKRVKAEISDEKRREKIRLNMTLDSALRLLRDEQNDVKLKIPISGNINDPQFSVADAINQVLAKTLQKSALSYLKYMLGPYGIGISVAEFAYEQATKIRLNPILFAPGSDDLDETAIDYLKRVAAIMKDYPEVQVSVCGVATESDRAAMNKNTSTDTALLALARNRADSIEDQLVKLNGIDSNRIIACAPDIDKSAEGKPRADLEI